MAYKEKVWNANVLTDLLSTYLTHKSGEREKYYQAEVTANKPIYRTVNKDLYSINPATGESSMLIQGEPTPKKPIEIYDPITGGKKYVSWDDAINKPSEAPIISEQNKAVDFITGFKNKYPDINVSDLEGNIQDVDTKEENTFLRGELGKRESRFVSNKKGGLIASARNTIKGNASIYNKLGDKFSMLDEGNAKLDYTARKREKKALQNTIDAYGMNRQVYLKEDLPKLKEEYLKLIPKNVDKKNIEKIKNMNADELFNEIERMEEKHGIDLPFWLHRERYKGFNEFENLLNSMVNVTKE